MYSGNVRKVLDFGRLVADLRFRGLIQEEKMGYLYDLVIESGHFGRIRFPYVWDGNAVVYRRLRPLEQFVRDDGLCGLGYGVRRVVVRTQEYAYVCVGYFIRGDHLVRVRLELDGPADQSAGSGLEIPMVDVPCGGYRGSLWFLRY